MKIVHVVPYRLDAYSGVYTAIVGLAGALAGAGHEVEAWNLSPWPSERPELAEKLDSAGVTRRELPPSSQPWSLTPEAKQMIDADLHADIVHLHSAFSLQNNLLARRIEYPIVLSPHGVFSAASLAKSRFRKRVFRRLFELRLLTRVDAVTALTSAEASEAVGFGYRGGIEVIPNGVDDPVPDLDGAAFRAEIAPGAGERLALFVGRIDLHHKRLDEAARQVAAAPGWHLAVIGSDYRGDEVRLQAIVDGLPGGDRVHLLGPRRGRALSEAYAGADVFVLISRFEGLSMALLEALAHGLPPVVGMEVEDVLPVAAVGAGWSTSPEGLAGTLNSLTESDSKDWDARRMAALRLVEPYRWDAIAGEYGQLYRSLIADTPGGR
jgi:glycosyltransferase involved in cell wall biosynthesis